MSTVYTILQSETSEGTSNPTTKNINVQNSKSFLIAKRRFLNKHFIFSAPFNFAFDKLTPARLPTFLLFSLVLFIQQGSHIPNN